MADEEQIIRDRLTVDERNLRRVTRKMGVFLNSLEMGNLKEARVQFNDFIVDFSSYEIGLIRFQVIHDMNLRETQHWEEEALNIENQIEETKRIIEKLEAELEAEEEIRRNKIEYDQLASEINEIQSREESINEITKLDEETALIEEKERLFDETLSRRKAQLERVLSVVQDVQSQIQIEHEQNRHILGADDEPDATPESIRSEFASPIGSPIPDIQMNGTDETTHENVDTVNNNIQDQPQTNGNDLNSPRPINGDSTPAMNDDETPVLRDYQDRSDTPSRQDGSSNGSEKIAQETIPEDGAVVGEAGEVDEEGSVEEMGEVVEDDDSVDENMADVGMVASDEDDYSHFQQEQEDECDDIPILDDGEIVEDVEDVFIGKRKRGDDEDNDDDEEGSLHEKHSRISMEEYEDEGVIEESDGIADDDGAVDDDDNENDEDDDDNATIEDNEQ